MKKKIYNNIKFLTILILMLTAMGVGSYGMFYALVYGWMNILMFLLGAAGFMFSIYTLSLITDKLN
tara:strand:+ start:63 stop:260 length:198 start_codon:yes stop_codon:yes gene_type:complete